MKKNHLSVSEYYSKMS
jgi:hypothetical protein